MAMVTMKLFVVFSCVAVIHCKFFDELICPDLEEFSRGCERTCQNPEQKCDSYKEGCYCKYGWVRNDKDKCVDRLTCTEPTSPQRPHMTTENPTKQPCNEPTTPPYPQTTTENPTKQPCNKPTTPPCSQTTTENPTKQPCNEPTTPQCPQTTTKQPCNKPTTPPCSQTTTENPTKQPCNEPTTPQCPQTTTEDPTKQPCNKPTTPPCSQTTTENPTKQPCNEPTTPQCPQTTTEDPTKQPYNEPTTPPCSQTTTENPTKQLCNEPTTPPYPQTTTENPTKQPCNKPTTPQCPQTTTENPTNAPCIPTSQTNEPCFTPTGPTQSVPTCPSPNEEYLTSKCERTCDDIHGETCNRLLCSPGCACKIGYVRHSSGECIHLISCFGIIPTPKAPSCSHAFEEYRNNKCERTCEDILGSKCNPESGVSGCVCKLGYVRHSSGVCTNLAICHNFMLKPNVMTCSHEFEEYQDRKCEKTCEDILGSKCNPESGVSGCVCKLGFVRHSSGTCMNFGVCLKFIPKPNVTSCSNEFEEYLHRKCERTCENVLGLKCNPNSGVSGCVCKLGYVRHSSGMCTDLSVCKKFIPGPDEMSCSHEFEEYRDHKCERTCEDVFGLKCNPESGVSGCVCKLGYVRHSSGTCKNLTICLKFIAKPNGATCRNPLEEYRHCECERTCDDVMGSKCSVGSCKPSCVCRFGFVRHTSGRCMNFAICFKPKINSSKCSNAVEEYQQKKCERTCEDLYGSKCNPESYTPGCVCKIGHVRHSSGICVNSVTCHNISPTPNGPNCHNPLEEHQDRKCERTCEDPLGLKCIPKSCTPGCVCKLGYVRLSSGLCVNLAVCHSLPPTPSEPNCSNPFEEYQVRKCERTCEDPLGLKCIPKSCTPGCVCKLGYVRQSSGICINLAVCLRVPLTPSDCLKPWETYEKCCCERTCDDKTGKKCNNNVCEGKCVCREGFVRDANGNCEAAISCYMHHTSSTSHTTSMISSVKHSHTSVTHGKVSHNGKTIEWNGHLSDPQIEELISGILSGHHSLNNIHSESHSTNLICNGANEEYKSCGCDGVCGEARSCYGCTAGCYCKAGFIRNKANQCVYPIQCLSTAGYKRK